MRVLLVEDDMVIAGGLRPVVVEAGHEVVGLAADRDTAIALLETIEVHLVLIDLRLADGWTGIDVARCAAAAGVPAVFATANRRRLPEDFADAIGAIAKPYAERDMSSVLTYLADNIGQDVVAAPPSAIELSPRWRARVKAPERSLADA